ncbi:MAG TPA: DUF512 domain-containing protein, partial [Acidimicrobiales bacterium]|nr:DUF512 domain-containing protein [Acidimicrobiales bacterium]
EPGLRFHTPAEAGAGLDTVGRWQETFLDVLGRRLVFAADEYHLLAGRPFPDPDAYEGFPQHENGIGMAAAFAAAFAGDDAAAHGVKPGFFAWVDGAPAEGYRAPRAGQTPSAAAAADARPRRTAILTGEYGAAVLRPVLDAHGFADVRTVVVPNRFFGGNIAVAGLLTGADVGAVLAGQPDGHRYLLPDVCLSEGRFLDGTSVSDLPRPVEVVATDGLSLRRALEPTPVSATAGRP